MLPSHNTFLHKVFLLGEVEDVVCDVLTLLRDALTQVYILERLDAAHQWLWCILNNRIICPEHVKSDVAPRYGHYCVGGRRLAIPWDFWDDHFVQHKKYAAATTLMIDATCQLALLTTSDGLGPHTRSVLLVPGGGAATGTEMYCVDNLSFTLTLSVHQDLNPYLLVEAMHDAYFRDHYSKEQVTRVWRETLPPEVLALPPGEKKPPNTHPLFRIAHRQREFYEQYQRCVMGDEWRQMAGDRLTVVKRAMGAPHFFFVKHQTIFTPAESCRLGAKLRGRQLQWRLTFDNHRTVLYFIEQFKRPFFVQGSPTEVQVVHTLPDHTLELLDQQQQDGREAAWQYVMRQTPALAHAHDRLPWSFETRTLLQQQDGFFVQRARQRDRAPTTVPTSCADLVTERVQQTGRVALNVYDFSPAWPCYWVDYAKRVVVLAPCSVAATSKAATKKKKKEVVEAAKPDERGTAFAKLRRPGVKRLAQQTLSFGPSAQQQQQEQQDGNKKRKVQ